jgi:hypothetical protein
VVPPTDTFLKLGSSKELDWYLRHVANFYVTMFNGNAAHLVVNLSLFKLTLLADLQRHTIRCVT